MDSMDVNMDSTTSLLLLGVKRSSISPSPPSVNKCPKLKWSDSQRTNFNNKIKTYSAAFKDKMMDTGDDNSKWRNLFSQVLQLVTVELSKTILQSNVTLVGDIHKLVTSLEADEIEEWKDAVRKGAEEGDWDQLITHCMHCFAFQCLGDFYQSKQA